MSWGVATQNGVSVSLASIVSLSCGATEFSPYDLFTSGVAGAWYDPSDYSTLFQDSAGTTPVTAVEQPVGLMLDKSQGLVLGSELVTNGDFSSGLTGWTNGSTGTGSATAPSGAAVLVGIDSSNAARISQGNTVVGKTYKVTFDLTMTSGTAVVEIGGTFRLFTTSGSRSYYEVATNTSGYVIRTPGGGGNFTIDNISVKEIAGNHASQATAASRPVLRARYNLLTYSEQFDNAGWTKNAMLAFGSGSVVNATTAPDGTTTADLLVPNTTLTNHAVQVASSLSAGIAYTASIYAKASGYDKLVISDWNEGTRLATFDLTNVTATLSGTGATVTLSNAAITSVGSGWYRCSVQITKSTSGSLAYYLNSAGAFSGDGTSGIYIWGADLRTGSSAGTYQRIAAATDYATAGFLPYLAFDGVDDVLVATPASADYILNSVAFGAQFNAFSGNAVLGSIGNSTTGNPFSYINENSGTSVFGANARNDAATSVANYIGTTDLLPHVLISIWDTSGSSVRNNSSVVTGSAFTGVMTVNKFALGALGRNTNSAFSNSRIYSALFISPALTTAQSASLASYIAAKSGVTL